MFLLIQSKHNPDSFLFFKTCILLSIHSSQIDLPTIPQNLLAFPTSVFLLMFPWNVLFPLSIEISVLLMSQFKYSSSIDAFSELNNPRVLPSSEHPLYLPSVLLIAHVIIYAAFYYYLTFYLC